MPKISVFPVPRFIDLTFLSLQVLSKNILYFGISASKTAKGQVAIFALYRKSVSESISANGVHNRVKDNHRPRHEKPSGKPIPDLIPENDRTAATGAFKRKRRPGSLPTASVSANVVHNGLTDNRTMFYARIRREAIPSFDRRLSDPRTFPECWRERSRRQRHVHDNRGIRR